MAGKSADKAVSGETLDPAFPVEIAATAEMPAAEKRKRGRPPKVRPVVFQAPVAAVDEAPAPPAEVVPQVSDAVPSPADVAEAVEAAMSPAITSDPIAAAPGMSATIAEGNETMATIAPNPADAMNYGADKMQTVFGDVGSRFKAGIEKSTKLGEDMIDLAKGNVEAVVASAKVAAKGSEALGQDAAAYGKRSFESAVAAMKSFASVKSPTELFQLQSEFAKASFDSAVAEASKFSESMMKLAGDVTQPISTRYAVAADKIKSTAL